MTRQSTSPGLDQAVRRRLGECEAPHFVVNPIPLSLTRDRKVGINAERFARGLGPAPPVTRTRE
jgi:hypothetical protein